MMKLLLVERLSMDATKQLCYYQKRSYYLNFKTVT